MVESEARQTANDQNWKRGETLNRSYLLVLLGRRFRVLAIVAVLSVNDASAGEDSQANSPHDYQYRAGAISIPRAAAAERLEPFSLRRAVRYLDDGAKAWNENRKCLSCHTNGVYMTMRPALTKRLGKPPAEARRFLSITLKQQAATSREKLAAGLAPAQVIHVAAGLAEWDAHVRKQLSSETRQALDLMFAIQRQNGTWEKPSECWPPFESDSYHQTALAAIAVATAPGWLATLSAGNARQGVERLRDYLRTTVPPHDYARVWLLFAATRWKDLLATEQKQQLIELVWSKQRSDGGWSIRSFAEPEAWGDGKRAEKLRAELEFGDLASDGHQTGLALLVLQESGATSEDPRIRKAVEWLTTNQRASGRWWTRSLNTDRWHFITYSGTAYAAVALSRLAPVR